MNSGRCIERLTSYQCDCSLTGYTGDRCELQAPGYVFGNLSRPGILIYDIEPKIDTHTDEIALAFMTFDRDGTLVRIDNEMSTEFIELKLVRTLPSTSALIS